jgi:hypothetical protein
MERNKEYLKHDASMGINDDSDSNAIYCNRDVIGTELQLHEEHKDASLCISGQDHLALL